VLGVAGAALAAQPAAAQSRRGAAPATDTPPASALSSTSRVQAGTVVRPDTVEVGDPFFFIVTVQVPRDARVEWPRIDDSSAVVAMRAPVRIVNEGSRLGTRRERAEYELAAWDVGSLPLGLKDAVVHLGTSTLTVPLAGARVFVRSVLPGDTSLHVPKPARDLFERVTPWWMRWWPALLVLVLLLLLWWWRRRRKRVVARPALPPVDAYERAVHDFDRLERLALADAGETGRYVALAVDIMRMYLVSRVSGALLSLTSPELLVVVSDDPRVPRDRLLSLLADSDGVKFAARLVSAGRARELAAEARAVVEHIEAAERARRAAMEAERLAAAQTEKQERSRAEDDARRKSRRPKAGAS
jgi:hypothetical protein